VDLPEVDPAKLEAWHALAQASAARAFYLARSLYGINPQVPPPDIDLALLTTRSRAEVQAAVGLTRSQLEAELGTLRGLALQVNTRAPAPAAYDPRQPGRVDPAAGTSAPDLFERAKAEDPDRLLEQFSFDSIPFTDAGERAWFVERVIEWRQILSHKMAGDLARQTLLTAREVRRLGTLVGKLPANDDQYAPSSRLLQQLSAQYAGQLEQLNKIAPWMGLQGRGMGFAGMMADVTLAVREYKARGDTGLVDGIFQASELAVLCRMSTQAPLPQYRLGWVTYLNAARPGLWDPHWKNPLPAEVLGRLDRAFKHAYAEAAQAEGAHIPDLLLEGVEGEYETFPVTAPVGDARHQPGAQAHQPAAAASPSPTAGNPGDAHAGGIL
jgi:hypothetical protein